MKTNLLLDLKSTPPWKQLKNQIITNQFCDYKNHVNFKNMSSHDLIYVLVDKNENPQLIKGSQGDVESFCIFSTPSLKERVLKVWTTNTVKNSIEKSNRNNKLELETSPLKLMMLGELVEQLNTREIETSIKVNPLLFENQDNNDQTYLAEEVLFVPQRDSFTGKLLLTDPDDAKALLAINPNDQKRFGIELVFYMLINRELPEDREERESALSEKIEELSFKAPRIPMKKGSGTFLTILLNLGSDFEEKAFIRNYPMFDSYADVLFVTSSLKIVTGQLDEISYDGDNIDNIFGPMINWQRNSALSVERQSL